MDGQAAIEQNVEALKRILLSLVVMAGEGLLPRHLHRAILRLIRPAESAARRLIIAAARAVTVPPWRGPVPKKEVAGRRKRHFQPKSPPRPKPRACPRRLALPLTDPLQHPLRRARVRPRSIPRLWAEGMTVPRAPLPAPPAPDDPLDAARLRLRLDALGRALGDLPRQALRFARWRARQAYWRAHGARFRRPLRPGRPPGALRPGNRRREHEVHAVLAHAHSLGWWALNGRPDTS